MPLQSDLSSLPSEPVSLQVLEAVSPARLCGLLALFGSYANSYRDDIHKDATSGIASLHAALDGTVTILPNVLNQVLNAIDDLATDAGHQNILSALQPSGEPDLSKVRSASDLALLTYLDHPAAFDVAYGRAASRGARRYAVFAGAHGPMVTADSNEMRSRLMHAVGQWLALLEGHSRCDIHMDEVSGQISLLVLYQRGALATGVTMRDLGARFRSLPDFNALVTYHSQCGLLCVRAESLAEQHAYRRVFGRALFGDETWFQVKDVFTVDPLVERGIDALSSDGFRGVKSTALCGVEVVAPDREQAKMQLTAADLSKTMTTPVVQSALVAGTVRSMSIALSLSGFPRPLFAKIAPPNTLMMTGHFAQKEIAREFLVARGFMRLPAAA
jgi:hypothetical protein